MQTEIALRYEERGEFWSGGGLSCSAPFWRAFFERKKKDSVPVFQCSLLLLSLYDCLKIAADGPSVRSINTPSFFHPPKTLVYNPLRFSVIIFSPSFYYLSIFFRMGDATDAFRRQCARAKTPTAIERENPYSNRLFWDASQHEPLVRQIYRDTHVCCSRWQDWDPKMLPAAHLLFHKTPRNIPQRHRGINDPPGAMQITHSRYSFYTACT